MEFLTSWWMYLMGFLVMGFVLAQSVFFLVKASKRALELGFSKEQIRKTVTSSMIFSIAPSIAILVGLLTLYKSLGVIIPWIRLSVLGAVTYELPAATNVIEGVFQGTIGVLVTDPKVFVTVIWVMTLGCIPPLIIIPLFLKKIQSGVIRIQKQDSKWGEIFMDAMFIGMISAFVGYVVAPKVDATTNTSYISMLAILTLLASASVMAVCGVIITKYKQEWLKSYAIPISMISSMILAIVFALMGVK
ncbi:MAG TPA: DUF5058 family protein [Bacilli bacterium]|nr:DUF5058 family protein [Bacilli bacterium]